MRSNLWGVEVLRPRQAHDTTSPADLVAGRLIGLSVRRFPGGAVIMQAVDHHDGGGRVGEGSGTIHRLAHSRCRSCRDTIASTSD